MEIDNSAPFGFGARWDFNICLVWVVAQFLYENHWKRKRNNHHLLKALLLVPFLFNKFMCKLQSVPSIYTWYLWLKQRQGCKCHQLPSIFTPQYPRLINQSIYKQSYHLCLLMLMLQVQIADQLSKLFLNISIQIYITVFNPNSPGPFWGCSVSIWSQSLFWRLWKLCI